MIDERVNSNRSDESYGGTGVFQALNRGWRSRGEAEIFWCVTQNIPIISVLWDLTQKRDVYSVPQIKQVWNKDF